MKDIVRVGFFVAVEEPSGKAARAIESVIKKIAKKYEPQIDKLVNETVDSLADGKSKPKE